MPGVSVDKLLDLPRVTGFCRVLIQRFSGNCLAHDLIAWIATAGTAASRAAAA